MQPSSSSSQSVLALVASLMVAILVLTSASAAPTAPATPKGQTAAVINASEYCFFLPPKFGGNISANEDRAVAFCSRPITTAPNAQIFPKGFIKSVHFVANKSKNYVQVTGKIDRSKYGLSSKDGGGQYDMRAPVGSKCAGYSYFVNLIEPDSDIYCMRCCKNKADCVTSKSTKGCKAVIPGAYS